MIRFRLQPKHSHKVAVYLKHIRLSFKSYVAEKLTRKLLVSLLIGFVHWPNIFDSVWIAKFINVLLFLSHSRSGGSHKHPSACIERVANYLTPDRTTTCIPPHVEIYFLFTGNKHVYLDRHIIWRHNGSPTKT